MKKIPLIKPIIDAKKLKGAVEEISQSGILTKGKFVNAFENDLAKYLKVKYALTTTSATTALHLALISAGVGPGDEVLVSDFSFPASGNTVVQVGAKPVFVDIDLDNFCIDLADFERKITKKTKAVMVVHAFGYPTEMDKIVKIAKKHKIFVIEDAACAIGSKRDGKAMGTFGDAGCFSFHPRKVLTTGEGGAIVINNDKIAAKLKIIRNHGGVATAAGQEFVEFGYNYRMSELQAAMGYFQLKSLNKTIKNRQKLAKKLKAKLSNIESIQLPNEPEKCVFNFQSFVVLLDKKINRRKVMDFLAKANVESTLGTYAMHAQKSFSRFGYKKGDLPHSMFAYKQTLTLPLYEGLTEKDMDYIARNLEKAVKNATN